MVEVKVKIPEDLKDIIGEISETMYVEALKEVAHKRMAQTKKRLKEIKKKIANFEKKYGKSYEEFSRSFSDKVKEHDDWIEWSYLVKIVEELENKIEKLNFLLHKC